MTEIIRALLSRLTSKVAGVALTPAKKKA